MKNLYFKTICFLLLVFNSHGQGNDVIFFLDNSSSVTAAEYADMNLSVQNIIAEVLACNENNRIAVVQYGVISPNSTIFIESDFSDTPIVFPRRFSSGGAQAFQAIILVGNALDNVLNTNILGTTALTQTPGNSLVVYMFTDDSRINLVNPNSSGIGTNAAFQAYTTFKNDRDATFVVTIVPPPDPTVLPAVAAIASYDPTGLYVNAVESYPADPDGPGQTPRFLLNKQNFQLTVDEIDNVANHICSCSTDVTGIFYNSSANFQWDDTADNYIVEIIGNENCNWPDASSVSNVPSLSATITITDNFFNPGTLADLIGGNKEFMWRIRTECGEWSDWCCYDGNGDATPTFPNGSCFYTDQPCEGDYNLNITLAVLSGENVEEQASNILTANNVINSGAIADYRSINQVNLQSEFHAKSGSLFIARIVECDAESRPVNANKKTGIIDSYNGEDFINEFKNNGLKIIPNPSSSITEISLENLKMNNIVVTSMDGRIMFQQNWNSNFYKLDVSFYNKGIYLITVTTVTGEILNEKLVKN